MAHSRRIESRNLPPEYLRAIGQLTNNSAALEQVVHWLIWILADPDHQVGMTLTRELTMFQSIGRLRDRMDDLKPPLRLRRQLDRFLDETDAMRIERNRVVHAVWMDSVEPSTFPFGIATYRRVRNEYKLEIEPVSADGIMRTAKRIWTCFLTGESLLSPVFEFADSVWRSQSS